MTESQAVDKAYELLNPCRVCPRNCAVDRSSGELGFCGVGVEPLLSSAGPHFGEESCLVGRGGSGTIFLAGCNLGCVFCQNYDISHQRSGEAVSVADIVKVMLSLEAHGCENVNLVSPTHVAPQMLDAIVRAREAGLSVPLVWNSGGYESVAMLRLLDGHVDIYMPDIKYADNDVARRFSDAGDYWTIAREAIREMHRQVGDLEIVGGVARRGLLVRHLILPEGRAGTQAVVDFLAEEISSNTFINVMGQYRPQYQAGRFPELDRRPTDQEIREGRDYARRRGMRLAE